MKSITMLFALGLVLAACESSTGPSSNVRFDLSACKNEAAKTAAGAAAANEAELLFRSRDSISFAVPMELLCQAQYAMNASIASPETLSIAVTDVGSERTRCFCAKIATIGFRSPEGGLGSIRFVETGGSVYELK